MIESIVGVFIGLGIGIILHKINEIRMVKRWLRNIEKELEW